jgi:hypothetical protein
MGHSARPVKADSPRDAKAKPRGGKGKGLPSLEKETGRRGKGQDGGGDADRSSNYDQSIHTRP